MGFKVKAIKYYVTLIDNYSDSESKLLSIFSKAGVNYLACISKPIDSNKIEFTLYPNEIQIFLDTVQSNGLIVKGPYSALHVEGDDESGACADVFEKLSRSNVDISFSYGIADIKNGYGIIIHLNESDCKKAIASLEE